MCKISLIAIACVFSQMVSAQGWVSSGGELFRDAKNPWFVRSTKEVKYCIEIEKTNFSADLATVSNTIKEGFAYWKSEFNRSPSLGGDGTFEVATQNFIQINCNDASQTPDIRFLFGYDTLNPDEIKKLENPSKFIGITVRTDYSLQKLKGSGFVFFSSDQGPHAYDNNGSLIDKAWSRPRILKYAILHELGHIFGVPHMGSGLMSEVFLNQILNKNLVDKYESNPIESFIRPAAELDSCSIAGVAQVWFGMPTGYQCLHIDTSNYLGPWKVYAKKTKDANLEEIGEVRNLNMNLVDQRGRPAVILELNDQQQVFSATEAVFRSFMFGPFMIDMGMSGSYFSAVTKRLAPVYISVTPSSLSIQASPVPSRLEPVFIFNSPISVLMLISPKP